MAYEFFLTCSVLVSRVRGMGFQRQCLLITQFFRQFVVFIDHRAHVANDLCQIADRIAQLPVLGGHDQSALRMLGAQILGRTPQLLAHFVQLIKPELARFGNLEKWFQAGQNRLYMDVVAHATPRQFPMTASSLRASPDGTSALPVFDDGLNGFTDAAMRSDRTYPGSANLHCATAHLDTLYVSVNLI